MKFGQSLQLSFFRWSATSDRGSLPVYVCEEIRKTSRVLVCLPESEKEAGAALRTLSRNREALKGWNITLIMSSDMNLPLSIPDEYSLLTYSEKDMTAFGVLNSGMRRYLTELGINLALDLNVTPTYVGQAFTWFSRAKLRVSFYDDDREKIYNILLRRNPRENLEKSYQALLTYLLSLIR